LRASRTTSKNRKISRLAAGANKERIRNEVAMAYMREIRTTSLGFAISAKEAESTTRGEVRRGKDSDETTGNDGETGKVLSS